jgi:hypothetical protein
MYPIISLIKAAFRTTTARSAAGRAVLPAHALSRLTCREAQHALAGSRGSTLEELAVPVILLLSLGQSVPHLLVGFAGLAGRAQLVLL